jgi:hypothetical protein
MLNYNYLVKSQEYRYSKISKLKVRKRNIERLITTLKINVDYNTNNKLLHENEINYCNDEIAMWAKTLNKINNDIQEISIIDNTISRMISIKTELIENCDKIILHPNRIARLINSGHLKFGGEGFLTYWGWD